MVVIQNSPIGGLVSGFLRVAQRRQEESAQWTVFHCVPQSASNRGSRELDERDGHASNRQTDQRFNGHRGR
jgi:hypothetical protein